MGISILSYCGSATLGVISDAHLVPDPEAITQEFNHEFAAMLKAVREKKAPVLRKATGRVTPAAGKHGVRAAPPGARRVHSRLRAAASETRQVLGW
jgi:hypothetical protein